VLAVTYAVTSNYYAHAKFEVAQPFHWHLIAFLLLICYIML